MPIRAFDSESVYLKSSPRRGFFLPQKGVAMAQESGQLLAAYAVAGSATSITATTLGPDGFIAMGSIAGCFFFLAITASMRPAFRIFSVAGSFIFGFLCGVYAVEVLQSLPVAALLACGSSALVSWVIGSLARWADGGERPDWITFSLAVLKGVAPSFLQKGKDDHD